METRALYFFILLSFVFAISSCKKDKIDPVPPKEIVTEYIVIPADLESPTINKGYYGRHLKWKRLPKPSNVFAVPAYGYGEFLPVTNEIYIYPPLTGSHLEKAMVGDFTGLFYIDKIKQKPLYIIKPNNKGFYQIDLPKGQYSYLMQVSDTTSYGNLWDGDGNYTPLFVKNDQLFKNDFMLDIEQRR